MDFHVLGLRNGREIRQLDDLAITSCQSELNARPLSITLSHAMATISFGRLQDLLRPCDNGACANAANYRLPDYVCMILMLFEPIHLSLICVQVAISA